MMMVHLPEKPDAAVLLVRSEKRLIFLELMFVFICLHTQCLYAHFACSRMYSKQYKHIYAVKVILRSTRESALCYCERVKRAAFQIGGHVFMFMFTPSSPRRSGTYT